MSQASSTFKTEPEAKWACHGGENRQSTKFKTSRQAYSFLQRSQTSAVYLLNDFREESTGNREGIKWNSGNLSTRQQWTLAPQILGSRHLSGLRKLADDLKLQPGQIIRLGVEGSSTEVCMQRQSAQNDNLYLLFLQGEEFTGPVLENRQDNLEDLQSSAESRLRSDGTSMWESDFSGGESPPGRHETQAYREDVTPEEDLASLLKRIAQAKQAVNFYNSSAECGLQDLDLASQYENSDGKTLSSESEQNQKLYAEMTAWKSCLQEAMQEISSMTNEVKDLSDAWRNGRRGAM